jgi:hypothetical protein
MEIVDNIQRKVNSIWWQFDWRYQWIYCLIPTNFLDDVLWNAKCYIRIQSKIFTRLLLLQICSTLYISWSFSNGMFMENLKIFRIFV